MFTSDSAAYLQTAVHHGIPLDRSFVYGFFIGLVAPFHSLTPLVLVQITASAALSILVACTLRHFFSVEKRLAFAMALLCALEPIQLLYERYVMTETLALVSLVVYLLLVFNYLQRPNLVKMVLVQAAGVLVISIRLSFLPLVFVVALLLPLLAVWQLGNRAFSGAPSSATAGRASLVFSFIAIHLLVSLGTFAIFHVQYKAINGRLTGRAPAYQYHSGYFLLADWGPVVKPEDCPLPDRAGKIFGNLPYHLDDRRTRGAQRWAADGLIARLCSSVPVYLEPERVARETALQAFRRDPVGIAALALDGFRDYWDLPYLQKTLSGDRGARPLTSNLLKLLSENFQISDPQHSMRPTLTGKLFSLAWPWHLFLLCSPILPVILLLCCHKEHRAAVIVMILVFFEVFAVSIALIERPTVRYLHPLGWLVFIVLGLLLDRVCRHRKTTPPPALCSEGRAL